MQWNMGLILFNDRHNTVIKTRKHIILSAFPFIITACLAGSSFSTSCNDTNTTNAPQFELNLVSADTEKVANNASRKKRMRKPNNKEQKKKHNRTYQDFEYDELVEAKNAQVAKGNTYVAIKYLEQLMKLCTDVNLLAEHLLELGDLFFIDQQFQKASHIYTQYCALYPGNEKQEYALYRSIMSAFACILPIDRDQTQTEETLARTEIFLKQDHFTQYRDEVTQIQIKCYEHLAANECNICNFYLTRGKLTAAEKRLKKIRSHWLPKIPTIEPDIIALEAQLNEKTEEIKLLYEQHIKLAYNKKSKHMADRF